LTKRVGWQHPSAAAGGVGDPATRRETGEASPKANRAKSPASFSSVPDGVGNFQQGLDIGLADNEPRLHISADLTEKIEPRDLFFFF
jgi:hypothetical protein